MKNAHEPPAPPSGPYPKALLHALPVGLIHFGANKEALFVNQTAFDVLRHERGTPLPQALFRSIEKLLNDHADSFHAPGSHAPGQEKYTTEAELLVPDKHGHKFPVLIRIKTLVDENETLEGYLAVIDDISSVRTTGRLFETFDRTRARYLHTAATCFMALQEQNRGIIVSPLLRLAEWMESIPSSTSAVILVTSLVEFLDLILDEKIPLKVQVNDEASLAAPGIALFELLGTMVFYVIDATGLQAEVSITEKESPDKRSIFLTVEAKRTAAAAPTQSHEPLSRLLKERLADMGEDGSLELHSGGPLELAKSLAKKHQLTLQHKTRKNEVKIRVQVPREF